MDRLLDGASPFAMEAAAAAGMAIPGAQHGGRTHEQPQPPISARELREIETKKSKIARLLATTPFLPPSTLQPPQPDLSAPISQAAVPPLQNGDHQGSACVGSGAATQPELTFAPHVPPSQHSKPTDDPALPLQMPVPHAFSSLLSNAGQQGSNGPGVLLSGDADHSLLMASELLGAIQLRQQQQRQRQANLEEEHD